MYFIVNSSGGYLIDHEMGYPYFGTFEDAIRFRDDSEAWLLIRSFRNQEGLDVIEKEVEGEDFTEYERNSYIYDNCGRTPNDPDFDPCDF